MQTAISSKTIFYSALFAALTAAGAQIRIPMPPVPFTLQTVFVFLAGGIFGAKVGFSSQALYLFIGLLGLPVFSGGGGIGYVMQPQFGYLLGMPFAALAIGYLSRKISLSPKWAFLLKSGGVYFFGTLIIYLFGVSYLMYYNAVIINADIDPVYLAWAGAALFIPMDIVKIAAAVLITYKIRKALNI